MNKQACARYRFSKPRPVGTVGRVATQGPAKEHQSMPPFFEVKWPGLARLEVALLLAATLWICGESSVVRSVMLPPLTLAIQGSALPGLAVFWTLLCLIVALSLLCAIAVVDRLLIVRNGLAILSMLSVPVWAAVIAALSGHLAHDQAISVPIGDASLPGAWLAAAAAGCASLLVHARPLLLALSGTDDVLDPNPRSRRSLEPGRQGRAVLVLAGVFVWVGVCAATIAGYVIHQTSHGSTLVAASQTATAKRPVAQPGVDVPPPAPLPKVWSSGRPVILAQGYGGEASAKRRSNGHFYFEVEVNGVSTWMMVDTGAGSVALRWEDAERLGIDMDGLKFNTRLSTGNGTVTWAATKIDTLTVGTITQHDVPAWVASRGKLFTNLLGQSFLRNVREMTVEDNEMLLRGY